MGKIKSVITRYMKIGVAIAISLVLATPAHADPTPTFNPSDPDSLFAYALNQSGLLFNFPLEKLQGQRACHDYAAGDTSVQVIHNLMDKGSYSFDVANGIFSAAMAAYCLNVPYH